MDDWVDECLRGRAHGSAYPLRQQTITVTVPRKPSRAGIDPENLLIDLDTENNIKGVKIEN